MWSDKSVLIAGFQNWAILRPRVIPLEKLGSYTKLSDNEAMRLLPGSTVKRLWLIQFFTKHA